MVTVADHFPDNRSMHRSPQRASLTGLNSTIRAMRNDVALMSYGELTLEPSGGVMSKETKALIRSKEGYCVTCPGIPVLLVDIRRKSRLNPLLGSTRLACSVPGESFNGICLKCHPEQDPQRSQRFDHHQRQSSHRSLDTALTHHHHHLTTPAPRVLATPPNNSMAGARSFSSTSILSVDSSAAADYMSVSDQSSSSILSSHHTFRTAPVLGGAQQQSVTLNTAALPSKTAERTVSAGAIYSTTGAQGQGIYQKQQQQQQQQQQHQQRVSPTRCISEGKLLGAEFRRSGTASSPPLAALAAAVSFDPHQQHHHQQQLPPSQHGVRRTPIARTYSSASASAKSFHGGSGISSHSGGSTTTTTAPPFTSPAGMVVGCHDDDDHNHKGGEDDSFSLVRTDSLTSVLSFHELQLLRRASSGLGSFGCVGDHSCCDFMIREEETEREDDDPTSPNAARESSTGDFCMKVAAMEETKSEEEPWWNETVAAEKSKDNEAQQARQVIAGLKGLVDDLLEGESYDVLADILLSTLEQHMSKKSQEVVAFCVESLAKCCEQPAFVGEGASSSTSRSVLLQAMRCFPDALNIQEAACAVVMALCATERVRLSLVEAGVCSCLCAALAGLALQDVVLAESAVAAIRTLSLETQARTDLEKLNASDLVVQVMVQHSGASAEVQRDGCAFLSNMAVQIETKQVAAVSSAVMHAIVLALQHHRSDPSVVASACFALKNLTFQEANLRHLRHHDASLELLAAAADRHADCRKDASYVLERLQILKAQDESLEEEARESLLTLVECNLPSGSSSKPEKLVEQIVDIMKHCHWSPRITTACLHAVQQAVEGLSKSQKLRVLTKSILETLIAQVILFKADNNVHDEARRFVDCFAKPGSCDSTNETIECSFRSLLPYARE